MNDEIMGFFKEFDGHNKFVSSLSATFLMLILKNEIWRSSKILGLSAWLVSLYKYW